MFMEIQEQSYPPIKLGKYLLTVADEHDLAKVLELRFKVFNEELGEGLAESFETQQDRDQFDMYCTHLVVKHVSTGQVVGTYRLQTYEQARNGIGFYSEQEFVVSDLPQEVLFKSIELGRACIAKEHRNKHVLFLLWKGLRQCLELYQKRYFFGCCSLTSQLPQEGWAVQAYLEKEGYYDPQYRVSVTEAFQCPQEKPVNLRVALPKLFKMYLMYGTKVCSPPAIDRGFKTIDFLVLFDAAKIDPKLKKMLA